MRKATLLLSLLILPTPAFAAGPKPRPAPPPAQYQHQPDDVAREYLAGLRKIEQKALGMGLQHAKEYRKSARPALVRKLCKAYNYTEGQIHEAVNGLRAKQADEARRARPLEIREGVVGELQGGGLMATNYFAIEETAVFLKAGDKEGIEQQLKAKTLVSAPAPAGIRILEVHDYRRIGKGYFVRVRFLDGPYKDQDGYCFPGHLNPR